MVRGAEAATDSARQIIQGVAESAQRVAAATPSTGFMFWDMWLGMARLQPSRPASSRGADFSYADTAKRDTAGNEHVIALAEEILTVGTRKVSNGTTRVRRYVVETPVERQVTWSGSAWSWSGAGR